MRYLDLKGLKTKEQKEGFIDDMIARRQGRQDATARNKIIAHLNESLDIATGALNILIGEGSREAAVKALELVQELEKKLDAQMRSDRPLSCEFTK